MSDDPVVETRTYDQLPRLTAVSPDALTGVQELGGPVGAIEIRKLLGRLIQTDTAMETEADLQAELEHDAFSVGLVFADPAPAKNGWYRKVGVSGAGNWVQFEKLSSQAAAEVADLVADAAASAAIAQAAADTQTRIAAAEGRAALYGITDPLKAQTFGAYGVELDFSTGFYRVGHSIEAQLLDLDGFTFNRDSTATAETAPGVVQAYAEDAPRIVPGTGLLIEPASQNFILRSQEFNHATWDKIAVGAGVAPAVIANNAVAPDGSMTADKIVLSLGAGATPGDRSHLQQDLAPVAGNPYAGSLWVKGVAGQKIVFRHVAGGGYFLHTFDGQWQRMSTVEVAAAGFATFEFGLRGGFGTSAAVEFHAWGGQVEAGNAATSYMPTGEFSFTRDEDTALLEGFNVSSCTVLIEATLTSGPSDSALGRRAFLTLYAGSGANDILTVINDDAGGIGAVIQVGGAVTGVTSVPTIAASGELQKLAVRLDTDNSLMVRNAQMGRWVFDGDVPAIWTKLGIGGSPLSTLARLGGYIHRIAIIPSALSDSDMIVRTGGLPFPNGNAEWQRVTKDGGFPHRDSGKTFKLGGYQYLAGGYSIDGDRHDLRRSLDGQDFSEIVNADPEYDAYSQVIAFGGKIYAWNSKMFVNTDGGFGAFTQILPALPWGQSDYDNRAIVYNGRLLFFHGTGDAPGAFDGVWEFDPVAISWTRILAAPWGARYAAAVGEFKGKLYLCGGYRNTANVPPETTYPGKTTLNDMYELEFAGGVLGAVRIVEDMPIAPRAWPALIECGDFFYLLGGYDNIGPAGRNYDETFVSSDARAWSLLPVKTKYLQRHAPTSFVVNATIHLVAGNANAAAPDQTLSDIWKLVGVGA